jgi:hypothetical protein
MLTVTNVHDTVAPPPILYGRRHAQATPSPWQLKCIYSLGILRAGLCNPVRVSEIRLYHAKLPARDFFLSAKGLTVARSRRMLTQYYTLSRWIY